MKQTIYGLLFSMFLAVFFVNCSEDDSVPPEDFNSEVTARGKIDISEEFPETPVGNPVTEEVGNLFCTSQLYRAAAGHNGFLVGGPFSDVFPTKMYYLKGFEDGGLNVFPADLAPATISWSLANSSGDITCDLEYPSLSEFRNCEKDVLSNVNGPTDAEIEYTYEQVYDASQIYHKIGLDFHGFGARVASEIEWHNSNVNSITLLNLTQVYYTVDADLVGRTEPSDWFNPIPDPSKLTKDGAIAYVSSMKFGRRLIMSISSKYDYKEVKAVFDASYNAVLAGGNFEFTSQQKKILSESTIKVFALGGPAGPILELITDLSKLKEYLVSGANYSENSPGALIGFTLRYLMDNSIVKHVATTEYWKRDCEEITPQTEIAEFHPKNGGYYIFGANHTNGDQDFKGPGAPTVDGSIELRIVNEKKIVAEIFYSFIEEKGDRTSGFVEKTITLYIAPSGKKINKILSADEYKTYYVDQNTAFEVFNNSDSKLIKRMIINGDTGGTDVPCTSEYLDTEHYAWVKFKFNPVKVELIEN